MDKKEIEKQAKEILDKFASTLAKVEKEHDIDSSVDREEFEREEMKGDCDCINPNGFKEKILKNAPEADEDFILTEKGDWK